MNWRKNYLYPFLSTFRRFTICSRKLLWFSFGYSDGITICPVSFFNGWGELRHFVLPKSILVENLLHHDNRLLLNAIWNNLVSRVTQVALTEKNIIEINNNVTIVGLFYNHTVWKFGSSSSARTTTAFARGSSLRKPSKTTNEESLACKSIKSL